MRTSWIRIHTPQRLQMCLTAIALVVSLGCMTTRTLAQSGTSRCLPVDAEAARFLTAMKYFLKDTTRELDAWRWSKGLQAVDTTRSASVITDTKLCQQAADAYEKSRRSADSTYTPVLPSPRRVYLVRVDNVYAVYDPTVPAGEWRMVDLLSRSGNAFVRIDTFLL